MPWVLLSGRPSIRSCYLPLSWVSWMPSCWVWASTLTSQIALDMSYSSGLHRSALFGMGVVLFIISATLVGIVRLISKKKRG